jgi:hypothetical protein
LLPHQNVLAGWLQILADAEHTRLGFVPHQGQTLPLGWDVPGVDFLALIRRKPGRLSSSAYSNELLYVMVTFFLRYRWNALTALSNQRQDCHEAIATLGLQTTQFSTAILLPL